MVCFYQSHVYRKDVWDLVSIGQQAIQAPDLLWDYQIKKDQMAIGTAM